MALDPLAQYGTPVTGTGTRTHARTASDDPLASLGTVVPETKKQALTRLAEGDLRKLAEEKPGRYAAYMAIANADPFGFRQFAVRHLGKYITPKHPEALSAMIDATRNVQAETSLKSWKKYPGIAGQIGGTMAEFGAVGKLMKAKGALGAAKTFAATAALQLPTEREEQQPLTQTLGERAVDVGVSAGTGLAVGALGKAIPNPLYRIPAATGGFMGLTALQGGSTEEVLESGITVLGFEAVGLAQRGFHKRAIKAAIKARPELAKADPKGLEAGVKKVGGMAAGRGGPVTQIKNTTDFTSSPAPETTSVVDKLIPQLEKGLKSQKKLRKGVGLAQSKERGRRAAIATKRRDALIKQGMSVSEATAKTKMKGALLGDEYQTPEGSRPKLTDAEWNVMQTTALTKYPEKFQYYSQLRANKAINKIKSGEVLQNSEIDMMGDLFGVKLGKLLRKQQPFSDRLLRNLYDIGGFSKSVKASGDISFTFRQLLPVLGRSPRIWARSARKQGGAYFSEKKFKQYQKEVKNSPHYEEAMTHKLPLTDMGEFKPLSVLEEAYPTRFAKRWPLMKQGNRAAVAASNQAKMGLYEKIRAQWVKKEARAIKSGKRRAIERHTITDARLTKLSKYIGDLTGRSVLPQGRAVTGLANFLNALTFSPRFALSRVKNVGTLFHTIDTDPAIRMEGLKTLAGGFVTIGTMTLVAKMFGHDTETDPRSADFMKAKKGNTRYDLLGGHGQVIRFIARMASGETKTAAGDVTDADRKNTIAQFAKSKRAPVIGLIMSLYTGKDFAGKPIRGVGKPFVEGWSDIALDTFTYLWLQDAIEAFQEHNKTEDTLTALGLATPATVAAWTGFGVQTYEPTPRTSVALMKNEFAQEAYEKDWDELKPVQQRAIIRRHKDELGVAERAVKVEGAKGKDYGYVARLLEQNREAGDAVVAELSKGTKAEFKRLGVTVMLDRTVSNYRLNDAQYAEYQEATAQRLKTSLDRMVSSPAWKHYSDDRKEEKLKRKILLAKRAAQREVMRGVKQ